MFALSLVMIVDMMKEMVKRLFLTLLSLVSSVMMFGHTVSIPSSFIGQDYVLAARVEKVSEPRELGNMKLCAGLRVYNPQMVRFVDKGDSLLLVSDDEKRGPQILRFAVLERKAGQIMVNVDDVFKSIIRGVDILSGKLLPGKMKEDETDIVRVYGDASHLEVSVRYVYESDKGDFHITIRKSLMLLNGQPMQGRPVDKRLGFKSDNKTFINRFDLNKRKNILFYIDDAFPMLWRDAIKLGIEDWNRAFDRIGYHGVIKTMTFADAGDEFDPFDFRNNSFFYVDSDFANAMGCHWTDPRSGEILQADVLFYRNVVEKLTSWIVLQTGAYNKTVADGVDDVTLKRIIRYAASHEIGHCLGLEHNFLASSSYPTDSLRSPSFCAVNGTTPSIMDYARFNYVAQPGDMVEDVYPPLLGDYDLFAIEAGYGEFDSDESFKRFVDSSQSNARLRYKKISVSTLPLDGLVQQTDLGDNQLASSQYGISNLKKLSVSVLKQLRAEDVYKFYFQLLSHVVPFMDEGVKAFLENELSTGYQFLYSGNMETVFGNNKLVVDSLRNDFVCRVQKRYDLDLRSDGVSGMWLPNQVIEDDLFGRLRSAGMRMTKKELYDMNSKCLSGTVLSMSGDNGVSSPFASASFVSSNGLVLTNWHCVSRYIQQLSAKDKDFVKYGCWADSREQEVHIPNLEIHQMLSCEDVTSLVLSGTDTVSNVDVKERIADQNTRALMSVKGEPYGVSRKIYSMMGGNQYIMVRYRTFKDVRVVACPPKWLGNYGGDSDNWRWPRYACDFALLRVYVSKGNIPSYYDVNNVPFRPKKWLRFAKKPVSQGDFVMTLGYPSQTRKFIPSSAVDRVVNYDTKLRVRFLKAKIDLMKKLRDGATDTEKSYYDIAIGKLMNVYIRSVGEIEGVKRNCVVEIKKREDKKLQAWVNGDESRIRKYGADIVEKIDSVYSKLTIYNHMSEAFSQYVGAGATVIPFAGKFEKLMAIDRAGRKSRDEDMRNQLDDLYRNVEEYFTNVNLDEDLQMLKVLTQIYRESVPDEYLPEILRKSCDLDALFRNSVLTNEMKLREILDNSVDSGLQKLRDDSLYRFCIDLYTIRVRKQMREETSLRRLNTRLYKVYMQVLCDMRRGETISYDANHTMRFAPGAVMEMSCVSDMLGISLSKTGCQDYYMSQSFSKVMSADKNSLPIACFLANTETSSGNSGSAVVNSKGELVGLNFDRTKESAYAI